MDSSLRHRKLGALELPRQRDQRSARSHELQPNPAVRRREWLQAELPPRLVEGSEVPSPALEVLRFREVVEAPLDVGEQHGRTPARDRTRERCRQEQVDNDNIGILPLDALDDFARAIDAAHQRLVHLVGLLLPRPPNREVEGDLSQERRVRATCGSHSFLRRVPREHMH